MATIGELTPPVETTREWSAFDFQGGGSRAIVWAQEGYVLGLDFDVDPPGWFVAKAEYGQVSILAEGTAPAGPDYTVRTSLGSMREFMAPHGVPRSDEPMVADVVTRDQLNDRILLREVSFTESGMTVPVLGDAVVVRDFTGGDYADDLNAVRHGQDLIVVSSGWVDSGGSGSTALWIDRVTPSGSASEVAVIPLPGTSGCFVVALAVLGDMLFITHNNGYSGNADGSYFRKVDLTTGAEVASIVFDPLNITNYISRMHVSDDGVLFSYVDWNEFDDPIPFIIVHAPTTLESFTTVQILAEATGEPWWEVEWADIVPFVDGSMFVMSPDDYSQSDWLNIWSVEQGPAFGPWEGREFVPAQDPMFFRQGRLTNTLQPTDDQIVVVGGGASPYYLMLSGAQVTLDMPVSGRLSLDKRSQRVEFD